MSLECSCVGRLVRLHDRVWEEEGKGGQGRVIKGPPNSVAAGWREIEGLLRTGAEYQQRYPQQEQQPYEQQRALQQRKRTQRLRCSLSAPETTGFLTPKVDVK